MLDWTRMEKDEREGERATGAPKFGSNFGRGRLCGDNINLRYLGTYETMYALFMIGLHASF